MKWKLALPLTVCLLLMSCGQKDPADAGYEALISAAPVAQVEGEAVSPDGRFEIRGKGESGEYVSGVQPPEFLQIVDRETEEILWQDHGWLSQSVFWSPGSTYAALAYAARTWTGIKIFETDTWTAWDFTLPDGEPIPEYTFLPEDWCLWTGENNLELIIGGADGEPSRHYDCSVAVENGKITGRSWEITKEVLPGNYDFNHDGNPETLELKTVWFSGMTDAAVDTYVLSVFGENGEKIWQDEAGTSHAGENSLYACRVEGDDYLLRYQPYMAQGMCTYHYELFSLNETGEEVLWKENSVEFSINRNPALPFDLNPPEVAAFLKDVHQYLDAAALLVSTAEDNELFFLDYDSTLTLEENLQRYKESLEEG